MGDYKIKVSRLGEDYLLIDWPALINPKLNEELLQFHFHLHSTFAEEIIDSNTTYAAICISYDMAKISYQDFKKKILAAYHNFQAKENAYHSIWEIPVCYHPSLAPDLSAFCLEKKLDSSQVIQAHVEPTYRIYFIGFLPGFLYLGGLSPILHHPRKATPRTIVPAGSVGIAGSQTGIYPQISPGGWNLIGQTPIQLFDNHADPPIQFSAGDQLKFKSISLPEFDEIKSKVSNKEYILSRTTVGNDW